MAIHDLGLAHIEESPFLFPAVATDPLYRRSMNSRTLRYEEKDAFELTTYDIKGSTRNRYVESFQIGGQDTGKDLNFLESKSSLRMNDRDAFLKQIDSDTDFLSSQGIMDFSLLVGMCKLANSKLLNLECQLDSSAWESRWQRCRGGFLNDQKVKKEKKKVLGRRDNMVLKEAMLSREREDESKRVKIVLLHDTVLMNQEGLDDVQIKFEDIENLYQTTASSFTIQCKKNGTFKISMSSSICDSFFELSKRISEHRLRRDKEQFINSSKDDEEKNEEEEEEESRVIVYVGIIDILQRYNIKKVGEHFAKSVLDHTKALVDSSSSPQEMSAVPVDIYGPRFKKFVRDHVVEKGVDKNS